MSWSQWSCLSLFPLDEYPSSSVLLLCLLLRALWEGLDTTIQIQTRLYNTFNMPIFSLIADIQIGVSYCTHTQVLNIVQYCRGNMHIFSVIYV